MLTKQGFQRAPYILRSDLKQALVIYWRHGLVVGITFRTICGN